MIYGAGGGNFIGVIVGVDVNSGVGDADGDSVALGDSKGTAVAFACGDDVGDARDDVAVRDLEVRMSITGTNSNSATVSKLARTIESATVIVPEAGNIESYCRLSGRFCRLLAQVFSGCCLSSGRKILPCEVFSPSIADR
jgi:hypothetical protein